MMEAETGGICLQDKERREVPATSRSEEEERQEPPLKSSDRAAPCGHPDVRLLVSQTVREHSGFEAPQFAMIGYSKPRKPAQCPSSSALEAPTRPVPGAGVMRDVHWPPAGERVGPEPWSQARRHRQGARARGRHRRGSKGDSRQIQRGALRQLPDSEKGEGRAGLNMGQPHPGAPRATREKGVRVCQAGGGCQSAQTKC